MPSLQRLGSLPEPRHRLGRIQQVPVVAFGTAEMLAPQLQAQVARIGARAIAQARGIDGFPRIALLVHDRAGDLGVMGPRSPVEVVRPDRRPNVVDHADLGMHVDRDPQNILDIEDRDAVPAGIEEGKSIRLRGQGHPGGRSGPPGDVIVTIRYAAHPLFKVEGRDLRLDLPVTLYEAVLGARVRAPTLSGEVEVSIAAGSNGGRVLRLRGKGLPGGADQAAGDLMATLRIVLPNEPDAELIELMQKMRDQKPYQPRSGMA